MATEVIMPQMGESIFEGTITKWLKKAGDKVSKDEPLFEISTDKVDAEIPSPISGILMEIRVGEGETAQVNAVVAVVSEAGEAAVVSRPAPVAVAPSPVPQSTEPAPKAPAEPRKTELVPSTGGTEVVMPQMGESIVEGTITRWLKKVGDLVSKDEPLFEISTDKVDAEIPAPVAGILSQIRVQEGETVQVNAVVAVLGGPLDAPAPAPVEDKSAELEGELAQALAGQTHEADEDIDPNRRLRSSPLVRRIAREKDLDLTRIGGTGSGGRITKEDVLRHIAQHESGGIKAPTSAPKPQAASSQSALEGVVPLSKMRAIIAQRMLESKRISPHAHTVYKVDMTRIVRIRDREKSGFEKRNGVKLTYMPFIAAAVVETLRKFPIVNSSLIDGAIHYHPQVHLGIAVALEWGLIVPVIREAEGRNFLSLAQAIADLAARARSKKLMPDEISGSTFTLTNAGVFGGEYGTPIINQPESAILAIGGLKKEPVVLTDSDGNDTIGIRSMQYFCLGFDHRNIDGGDAGKFMRELQGTLEGWDRPIG
jgi:2-oxoglutarate dehydrogenase E2 component (dihydrolipoamide succinyltransferase)